MRKFIRLILQKSKKSNFSKFAYLCILIHQSHGGVEPPYNNGLEWALHL